MKIIGGSALSRGLNETFRNVLIEGTHRDSHGDKWSNHSAVRNETHPYFQKSENLPKLNGVAHEEEPRPVFWNQRTNEVHEDGMLVHSDGKVSPFSHGGNPKLFNSSHYFFHSDEGKGNVSIFYSAILAERPHPPGKRQVDILR